jgi:phenylacetate-CoA ligase
MYDVLLKTLVHPIANRRVPFLTLTRKLIQLQFEPHEFLMARQLRKLRTLLLHAYQTVPMYRSLLKSARIDPATIRTYSDLTRLPVITKETIRASFPEGILSRGLSKRGKLVHTAGSTGKPFAFFADRSSSAISIATRLFLDMWLGVDPGHKQLVIKVRNNWRDRLLLNEVALSPFEVTGASLARVIDFLNREHPAVVGGHPSALGLMAEGILSQQHSLTFEAKAGFTTAETLLPGVRHRLEKAFGAPFFDRYGASELNGYAGQECEFKAGIHVVPEIALIEVVRDGEHVGVGEKGTVLVTNLTNFVCPLIRYVIGDEAKLGDGCPCGRNLPMLEQVVGRTVDYVKTKTGSLRALPDFHIPLDIWKEIIQYQFVQRSQGELIVRIVPGEGYNSQTETRILAYLKQCAADMEYNVELVSEIPADRAGKRRQLRFE